MSVRLAVAVFLFAVLAAGLWWTGSSSDNGNGNGLPSRGDFHVFVVGPDGLGVANGTVDSSATPLDSLLALGEARGFPVEVEQQTWIGSGCTAAYVVGIAGHRETMTGGWNYYVRPAGVEGAEWTWSSGGAACHRLSPGDEVEWCWVEADTCRHHVP